MKDFISIIHFGLGRDIFSLVGWKAKLSSGGKSGSQFQLKWVLLDAFTRKICKLPNCTWIQLWFLKFPSCGNVSSLFELLFLPSFNNLIAYIPGNSVVEDLETCWSIFFYDENSIILYDYHPDHSLNFNFFFPVGFRQVVLLNFVISCSSINLNILESSGKNLVQIKAY